MSIESPNNSPEASKTEKPANSYNIPKQNFSWIPLAVAVGLLLPVGIFAWPHIPAEWLPNTNWLIKAAIGISVIALGIKLNTWLKNSSDSSLDSEMKSSGGAKASTITQSMPDIKQVQSKPLTKSHNMSYGTGKGSAKKIGQYRHEDKMSGGAADKLTLKGWGGSEGGGSADAAGRHIQKKPVRR